MRFIHLGLLGLGLTVAACAASSSSANDDDDDGSSSTGMGGQGGMAAGGMGGQGGVSFGGFTGSGGANPNEEAEVFGHSPDDLYRLDPLTNEVTVVGAFSGCAQGVLDIAIDKDNKIIATTFDGLYNIDPDTAACSLIQAGNYPNSLSFVPIGTLDANVEALVGYNDADYVRINPQTGAVSTVFTGALQNGCESSGDIVSVQGGGTYLTIKQCGCDDCLVQVNPATGAITKNWGDVMFSQVFGLAYWGGSAYGFSNSGQLFKINFGQDTVTTAVINVPMAPPDLRFWGAGSSTTVPIEPPN